MKLHGTIKTLLATTLTLFCTSHALAEAKSTDLPLFTPFNWVESSTGYIIKGNMCVHISNFGDMGCTPVTIVVDTPKNRMFMDFGRLGGQYYILNDISYVYNVTPGSGCNQVSGFTTASQITGYKTILSTPGSTGSKATYIGLAFDVGSCKERIATSITTQQGFLSEYDFDQMWPMPVIGLQHVTGMITLDPKSIDTTSDRAPYFVMPSSCNIKAPNFCK